MNPIALSELSKPVAKCVLSSTESYQRQLAIVISHIFGTLSLQSQNSKLKHSALEHSYLKLTQQSGDQLISKGTWGARISVGSVAAFGASLYFPEGTISKGCSLVAEHSPKLTKIFDLSDGSFDAKSANFSAQAQLKYQDLQSSATQAQSEGSLKDALTQLIQAVGQTLTNAARGG